MCEKQVCSAEDLLKTVLDKAENIHGSQSKGKDPQ